MLSWKQINSNRIKMKIISGAQNGADIAGLWAAKLFGIETGGYAPKGFITLNGPKPEMEKTFGIIEHQKLGYRDRTIANLTQSNLTIILSEKMSAGTKLTLNQSIKNSIPCYLIRLDPSELDKSISTEAVTEIVNIINKHNVLGLEEFIINIAGNSTNNSARAFEFAFKFCYKLFSQLGYTTTVPMSDWNKYKDVWK